jgi:hypothetical protein
LAGLFLILDPAAAKKKQPVEKQPTEQELADAALAAGFVGKTYDDQLAIDGWNDLGGGLVSPPIYVEEFQREDGTFLVLTSRETSPAKASSPAAYVVTGALIVPKPDNNLQLSIACVQGADETLRFIGEAKGSDDKEWWTDVRRAWEISLETGEIAETKTKGVRCSNAAWGQ